MYTVMHPGAEGLYAVLPRFINPGSTIHEASQRASAPQIPPDTPALLHCSHQKAGALGGGVWSCNLGAHTIRRFVACSSALLWSCCQVSLKVWMVLCPCELPHSPQHSTRNLQSLLTDRCKCHKMRLFQTTRPNSDAGQMTPLWGRRLNTECPSPSSHRFPEEASRVRVGA